MSGKNARARQFIYLHGAQGACLNFEELTPEEAVYVREALLYKAVQIQCEYYARKTGRRVVPADEALCKPPSPVGRFAK